MRKTTKGKGLAGGTAVAAVVAGLALLQSLGLAAVWGALPAAFAVLALAGMAAFFRARRRASGPSADPEVRFEEKLPCEAERDSKAAEDAESLRRQLETSLREHPGQGVALLRHWLTQEDTTPEGAAGGRESCN